jgi:hypothetical protein
LFHGIKKNKTLFGLLSIKLGLNNTQKCQIRKEKNLESKNENLVCSYDEKTAIDNLRMALSAELDYVSD